MKHLERKPTLSLLYIFVLLIIQFDSHRFGVLSKYNPAELQKEGENIRNLDQWGHTLVSSSASPRPGGYQVNPGRMQFSSLDHTYPARWSDSPAYTQVDYRSFQPGFGPSMSAETGGRTRNFIDLINMRDNSSYQPEGNSHLGGQDHLPHMPQWGSTDHFRHDAHLDLQENVTPSSSSTVTRDFTGWGLPDCVINEEQSKSLDMLQAFQKKQSDSRSAVAFWEDSLKGKQPYNPLQKKQKVSSYSGFLAGDPLTNWIPQYNVPGYNDQFMTHRSISQKGTKLQKISKLPQEILHTSLSQAGHTTFQHEGSSTHMATTDLGETNSLPHWLKNIKDQANVAHVVKEKKQTAGKSGISEEKYYELNNPVDKEKMSAWILGFTIYNANPVFQKLKSIHQGRISEFTERLEKIINQKFPIKKEDLTRINTSEQFEGFANLLWFINLEFLHSFGASEEYYLEEHFFLQDWVLKVLGEYPDSQLTSEQTADETSKKIQTFLQRFYSMFKCMSHTSSGLRKNLYQLGDRDDRKPFLGVLYKGPVDIVKIVLNSMIIFYATRNMKKWNFLFGHERNFIFHLVKIQVPDFFKGSLINVESNGKLNELTKLNVLPWSQPSVFGDQTHFLEDKVFEIEFHRIAHNYIQAISPADELQNSLQINPQSSFLMKNQPEKMWALMVKISSNTKTLDPSIILDECKKMENFDGNLPSERMLENVKNLFQVVWGCNARLIEMFGYKETDPIILQEQNKLQAEFFRLLGTPPHKSGSSGHQTEQKAHQILHSEMREFLSHSLSDQTKSQTSHPNLNLDYIFFETRKASIVVKMLTHFYQSRNYTKWLLVFEDEGKLSQAFEKIARRLEESRPMDDQTQELELESTGLFPWNHALSTTENQRKYIRSLFEE
ncbi:hypothetical protein PGT21_004396 [Puccinia graminis f. sp. tritici]|uniref:Uncharacterized protein n=1 Tax=Puccinia graminis f. sp. tritici TaxID=56615 RepID=A0A5B0MQM2_PUCGR|nr:hypothetical protein PGT21_004396 [Puccinia graminis f. sp. tritici]